MKLHRFLIVALVSVSNLACAQPASLRAGQALSTNERDALTETTPVHLGKQQFRIITPTVHPKEAGATQTETWLVNEQGVVGRSTHEVLVSQADPAAVRAVVASGALPAVANANYNATLRLSILRFASFADAVRARTVLMQRLGNADVTVPVQYDAPQAR